MARPTFPKKPKQKHDYTSKRTNKRGKSQLYHFQPQIWMVCSSFCLHNCAFCGYDPYFRLITNQVFLSIFLARFWRSFISHKITNNWFSSLFYHQVLEVFYQLSPPVFLLIFSSNLKGFLLIDIHYFLLNFPLSLEGFLSINKNHDLKCLYAHQSLGPRGKKL